MEKLVTPHHSCARPNLTTTIGAMNVALRGVGGLGVIEQDAVSQTRERQGEKMETNDLHSLSECCQYVWKWTRSALACSEDGQQTPWRRVGVAFLEHSSEH